MNKHVLMKPSLTLRENTSVGRKFAPVEGLSHDLVCTGSIYHVHFAWQVWHGQLSPRFKFNKLKSFSGVEIDQNHVDKRILGGKGFAVGRLNRHNFCPASVYIYIHIYNVWFQATWTFRVFSRIAKWTPVPQFGVTCWQRSLPACAPTKTIPFDNFNKSFTSSWFNHGFIFPKLVVKLRNLWSFTTQFKKR